MPRIAFRTRERLPDGSADPNGVVPSGFFQLQADGLAPGATLTVTLTRGAQSLSRSVQADANGSISVTRQVTNANILTVLESLGSASWDDEGTVFTAGNDTISLQITVS